MHLIVGATGQLGTAIVRKLVQSNQPVRAFVRPVSDYAALKDLGAELAIGDLRDPPSVEAACRNADVIIATANVTLPRPGDNFASVEGDGYRNLIQASQNNQVRQFIIASVPVTLADDRVESFRYKRMIEKRLQASGLDYTIVRFSVFMDVWLALIGSHIPSRRSESLSLARPFWFSKMYMGIVGGMIENRGIAVIPGNGKTRHAFITVDDVARFMVGCVGHAAAHNAIFHVGGPEILSWDDAVAQFAEKLGRKVKPLHTPTTIFRIQQALMKPFAEAPANILGMNWLSGAYDSDYPPTDAYKILDTPMTTMRDFLATKLQIADTRILDPSKL